MKMAYIRREYTITYQARKRNAKILGSNSSLWEKYMYVADALAPLTFFIPSTSDIVL